MAEFRYFTGPMDCGKSTLALQFDHTRASTGRSGRLFTSRDRAGEATISSRLGLQRPAIEVDAGFDFWSYVVDQLTGGQRVDYLICDEAQFYTSSQVDQLARIVDELQIDVIAVGILTDFRTRLFPGSQRLVELADRIEILQVEAQCWCGKRATHNARTVDGLMVTEGDQVVVGDTADGPDGTDDSAVGDRQLTDPIDDLGVDADEMIMPVAGRAGGGSEPDGLFGDHVPEVSYEVLCRAHHRRRVTRAVARATLSDPLPFDRLGDDRDDNDIAR